MRGWRTTTRAGSPEAERGARERAVELYDRGLELRTSGRYGEALNAWEKALALAPDNHVYQSSVQRMRGDLGRLRAQTPAVDVAGALRIARPTLGSDAGVGLYRMLRLVAFDAGSGAEAAATARAAGEKLGRSLGAHNAGRAGRLRRFAQARSRRRVGGVRVRASGSSCASASRAPALHAARPRNLPLRGWAAWPARSTSIFRRPVRVRETACIGGYGDDACRFEIELYLVVRAASGARLARFACADSAPRDGALRP